MAASRKELQKAKPKGKAKTKGQAKRASKKPAGRKADDENNESCTESLKGKSDTEKMEEGHKDPAVNPAGAQNRRSPRPRLMP